MLVPFFCAPKRNARKKMAPWFAAIAHKLAMVSLRCSVRRGGLRNSRTGVGNDMP